MRRTTQITTMAALVLCVWGCRDRSLTNAATVRAESAQNAAPAAGPVARRVLGNTRLGREGAPSPDGRYFTFTDWWQNDELAIHDFATGEDRHLTTHTSSIDEYAQDSTFSPDGRQVAYAWFNGSFYDLRIVNREGGTPRVVYANKELSVWSGLDWSSDGTQIACVLLRPDRAKEVALIKVADGSVRVLKTLDWRGPDKIALSPDERFILYEFRPQDDSKGRDLGLLSTDGTRDTRLVTDPSDDFVLGWVDNHTVLFGSDRGGTVVAWALDVADGKASGAPRLVEPDLWRMTPGRFSRNGDYYYFVFAEAGEVFTASIDPGTGKVVAPPAPLTPSSGPSPGTGLSPDWSPDGRYLAHISRNPIGFTSRSSFAFDTLTLRSLETGEIRELGPQMSRINTVRWFPDGGSFVVQGTDQKGRTGFHRIDAQTSAARFLLTSPGGWIPALSADGRRLYYGKMDESFQNSSIVERDLEGAKEREILRQGPGYKQTVILSPDGRNLAFSESWGLFVAPTSGGEAREIYRAVKPDFISSIGGFAWTPDGRQLVFATTRATGENEPSQLWRIGLDGGGPQKLDVSMNHIKGVRVHPDGRRIAFSAGQSRTELWVMENLRSVASSHTSAQRQ